MRIPDPDENNPYIFYLVICIPMLTIDEIL